MRTRLFLSLFFAAVTVLSNVAVAADIAHGVGVVVIDAGHGGRFPGAYYGGVYEKDLTLKVALKLGALIEDQMPGVKVVYTRKTDKALGEDLASDLQARADIANKAGGDIFISIHVNAARSRSARGVETLIMGESSKEQRYNETALFENNREDLIDMSDERTAAIVRAYIQNLQFTYGEYSMAMARCIQTNYSKSGRVSRGVRPQLLRVLYATDMPGVLTEIGFMSNAEEFAFLKSERGQNQIANNLLQAVKDYSACVLETRGGVPASTDSVAQKPAKEDDQPASETAPQAPEPAPKPAAKAEEPAAPVAKSKTPPQHSVRYAVQVMASEKVVSLSAAGFKNYRNKVKQYTSEGRFRYKYCVGESADQRAVEKTLREVRKTFPSAFVVKCRGKQIVK